MNSWQRWIQAPQTSLCRKALFQIHLWMGIGFGLYVLVISLSGSALLLKWDFYEWFEPKHITPSTSSPLEGEALTARMAEVYKDYELGFTMPSYEPDEATYIVLQKDGEYFPHYFNQYTGEDIGVSNPWPIKSIEWLAEVHHDLMLGDTGRKVNGIGGLLFVLMSLSGLILWWQGKSRWYEGLIIFPNNRRSMLWQLHSFVGFWALLLMLSWGVSGFELGFPRFVNTLFNWFGDEPVEFGRRPNRVLWFFRGVHYARFGEGDLARWGWRIVSFLPGILFISGVIVWWKRAIKKKSK